MRARLVTMLVAGAFGAGCGGAVDEAHEASAAQAASSAAPAPVLLGGNVAQVNPAAMRVAASGSEVYAVFATTSPTTNQLTVRHSADGGASWDAGTVLVQGLDVSLSGAIAIAADPADARKRIVHAVWGAGTSIYHSRLRAGQPWSAPQRVSGTASPLLDSAAVAADPVGGVHVAFTTHAPAGSASANWVQYSRSLDGGASFGEVATVVAAQGSYGTAPSVATDAAGDAFLAWHVPFQGAFFSKRMRASPAFTPPQLIGKAGAPLLAVRDALRIHVAYSWGGLLGSIGTDVVSSTDGGTTWTTRSVPSIWSQYLGFAVSPKGVLTLAQGGNGIYLTRSSNAGASWTTPVLLDSGENPSLVLNAAGNALITYDRGFGQPTYFIRAK